MDHRPAVTVTPRVGWSPGSVAARHTMRPLNVTMVRRFCVFRTFSDDGAVQRTVDEQDAWLEVPADEVPVNATVRYEDRGERHVGTVVDELTTPGATALVVLDADGAPRVVPTEARLEVRVDAVRVDAARVDAARVSTAGR